MFLHLLDALQAGAKLTISAARDPSINARAPYIYNVTLRRGFLQNSLSSSNHDPETALGTINRKLAISSTYVHPHKETSTQEQT